MFGLIAYLLTTWSSNQDRSVDHEEAAKWLGRSTAFSGPAIIFFVLAISFAAVDWVMSLDPHWFSTMYGLLFLIGWALSALCFTVIVLHFSTHYAPMNRVLGKRHFHDIGKLMLAFVMVWTYFNFSQYLIIWSGNIPEERVVSDAISNGWQGSDGLLYSIALFLILSTDLSGIRADVRACRFILLMRATICSIDKTNRPFRPAERCP